MGCGCGKRSTAGSGTATTSRRATVYQVLVGSSIESEFSTLPEARKAATEVGGRVKVTSKIVT